MKIALTFLTLSVVLLLGSLMWGMKTYTDLAHALSNVADLKQELERYRTGTATYPVAVPGVIAHTPAQLQAPGAAVPVTPAPPAQVLDESEIEARLEQMIASRLGDQEQDVAKKDATISDMEAELRAYELESESIQQERATLQAERERIAPTKLTADQNKIATAPVLAKVTEANAQYSFVVMDAGENKNLSVGGRFSIRREHMIIGEAVVDSVEPRESVANVIPSSIPAGVVIKPGDEVVEFMGAVGS